MEGEVHLDFSEWESILSGKNKSAYNKSQQVERIHGISGKMNCEMYPLATHFGS
jgi:hypothetical protein